MGWWPRRETIVPPAEADTATTAAETARPASITRCRPVAGVSTAPKHPQLAVAPPRARTTATTTTKAA